MSLMSLIPIKIPHKHGVVTLLLLLLAMANPWNKALAVDPYVVAQEIADGVGDVVKRFTSMFISSEKPKAPEAEEVQQEAEELTQAKKNQNRQEQQNQENKENEEKIKELQVLLVKLQKEEKEARRRKKGSFNKKELWLKALLALGGMSRNQVSADNSLSLSNNGTGNYTQGMVDLGSSTTGYDTTTDQYYDDTSESTEGSETIKVSGTVTRTVFADGEVFQKSVHDLDMILKNFPYKGHGPQPYYQGALTYGEGDWIKKALIKVTNFPACSRSYLKTVVEVIGGGILEGLTFSGNGKAGGEQFPLTHVKVSGKVNGKSYTRSMNPQECGNDLCKDYPNYVEVPSWDLGNDPNGTMVPTLCPPARQLQTPTKVMILSNDIGQTYWKQNAGQAAACVDGRPSELSPLNPSDNADCGNCVNSDGSPVGWGGGFTPTGKLSLIRKNTAMNNVESPDGNTYKQKARGFSLYDHTYKFDIEELINHHCFRHRRCANASSEVNEFDNGYSDGFTDGSARGHKKGHREGHREGYNEGYNMGQSDGCPNTGKPSEATGMDGTTGMGGTTGMAAGFTTPKDGTVPEAVQAFASTALLVGVAAASFACGAGVVIVGGGVYCYYNSYLCFAKPDDSREHEEEGDNHEITELIDPENAHAD